MQQKNGEIEGGSYMDYFDTGRFEGVVDQFFQGQGRRVKIRGTWEATRLAKDKFALAVNFDGGDVWQGNFRIVDQNHIHNPAENYDAVRVLR
ncbi:MAG: hypothetical protein H7343_11530 [Undibacterium sp.]|nr:hypothetical protein [Opitutaceae bacterium]